jgi:hypothetical protein
VRRLGAAASHYVRRAPGAHIYLLVLFVTTTTVQAVDPAVAQALLRQLSTNLYEMGRSAGQVLFLSAFLVSSGGWIGLLAMFTALYVPLERWAGTWRWLVVVVAGHVGATLVTTLGIWADVTHNRNEVALTRGIDVGISYGLMAAAAFLWFGLPQGWFRWCYLAALAAAVGVPLVVSGTFTDVGHATAACVGGACWLVLGPTLWGRPRIVLPWASARRHRRRRHDEQSTTGGPVSIPSPGTAR